MPADGLLLAAPFLSPRTRELLVAEGVGYADETGNVRVTTDRPAVFIDAAGASSSPFRESRPLRTLRGTAGGRVARALADFLPPYGVLELASIADTSPASASRIVDFLDREALVEVVAEGRTKMIVGSDWGRVLRRWAEDSPSVRDRRPMETEMRFLAPRGIDAALSRLKLLTQPYAVTGSLAATRRAPIAPARRAWIYVARIEEAAEALDLRLATSGSNVLLTQPSDALPFARTWEEDGIRFAGLSQVVRDLLGSQIGREPAEGEALLGWMAANEPSWRAFPRG
jgi:hypothetical protein